jgi:enoyl-CoA hydratase/carnithine racemase
MPTAIEISRRGAAAVLTLSGLDARGMFNTRILQELKQAIEEVPNDESVRALVLTGVGDQFCTGGNFGNEPDARAVFAGAFKDLVVAMARCKLPIVAAVNGKCTAGGMTFLGCTDYAIAVKDAKFGYGELAFGAFPMLALAAVPASLPKKTFFRWAYTCQPVDVEEMLRHELVNEAVEASQLWPRIDAFVTDLAGKSATAIARGRSLWYSTVGAPPVAHLDAAYEAVTGFPPIDHFK